MKKDSRIFKNILLQYINNTINEEGREKIIEYAKDLNLVLDNLKLLFENAWIDIFPAIIYLHQEYFYKYFSDDKVNKYFRDFIREPFVEIMVKLNTVYESNILNDTSHDTILDEDENLVFTRFKIAKQYYLAMKLVHPMLAKEIYDEAVDRYQLALLKEGYGSIKSYPILFNSLKTNYGKCRLITEVINNVHVEGYKIDPLPILNSDLLLIFESCLKSKDPELINFIGGYVEYLINFSRDEATINFKNKIIALLDEFDNIPSVNEFRKNLYYE